MERIVLAHSVPAEDAQIVAGCLLSADLRGVDTHGVVRLPGYLDRLRRWIDQPATHRSRVRRPRLHECLSDYASVGGRHPLLGTSPIAVGTPGGRLCPFVLDMSTAVAARGKIRKALGRGEAISEGYALDAEGRPTT